MLYAFSTTNRWNQPATIVCGADHEEEYLRWTKEHARGDHGDSVTKFYVACRPVSFQQKIQDKRYRNFASSIYEFSHVGEDQQKRFVAFFDIQIVSNDRGREVHAKMLDPDAGDDYPWEDQRSLGEIIGEQPHDHVTTSIVPVESSESSPVGVVDVRQDADRNISVNAVYRGKNANPDVPDEVLESDEQTLRRRYAHIDLPSHDLDVRKLRELAREVVTRSGWFYFPTRFLAVFQFEGDQHKYLQRLQQYQASLFALSQTEFLNLDQNTSTCPREHLPDEIAAVLPKSMETVQLSLYWEISLVGGCMIVPADEIISLANLVNVRQVDLAGRSVMALGIIDVEDSAWAVVKLVGQVRVIVLHKQPDLIVANQ